jgi:hypothetical protein
VLRAGRQVDRDRVGAEVRARARLHERRRERPAEVLHRRHVLDGTVAARAREVAGREIIAGQIRVGAGEIRDRGRRAPQVEGERHGLALDDVDAAAGAIDLDAVCVVSDGGGAQAASVDARLERQRRGKRYRATAVSADRDARRLVRERDGELHLRRRRGREGLAQRDLDERALRAAHRHRREDQREHDAAHWNTLKLPQVVLGAPGLAAVTPTPTPTPMPTASTPTPVQSHQRL